MYRSLSSLRFLFALMIFMHHFAIGGVGAFPAGGPCGVSFFMVLSGFALCCGYADKVSRGEFSWKTFMLKRLVKIYPLHLLCLAAAVLLRVEAWMGGADVSSDLKILPFNALLLQSWIPVKSVYFSFNALSWCLSDFLFFYAVFPFVVRLRCSLKSRSRIALWLLAAGLYTVLVAFLPESLSHAVLYIYPITRLLDFCLGVEAFFIVRAALQRCTSSQIRLSKGELTALELASVLLLTASICAYPLLPESIRLTALFFAPSVLLIITFSFSEYYGGVHRKVFAL